MPAGCAPPRHSCRRPLTPIAHRELMAWWMRCAQPESGVMFPSDARGGEGDEPKPYTSETAYRRALKNAAKRAKIGRRVNMYLLRDSFATIAWSLGIDMDVARRILRHADETMLREVYCRPRPADLVARPGGTRSHRNSSAGGQQASPGPPSGPCRARSSAAEPISLQAQS